MPADDGVRWDVLKSDIRSFARRLPGILRNDPSAVALVVANVFAIVNLWMRGEPVTSILVVYWIQMMILGFWHAVRIAVVSRWKALFLVPIFLIMYLSIINIFGILAGSLIDDQMQGTAWHDGFSLWNYWMTAAVFFANHGFSFYFNFIRSWEYETTSWEDQLRKPMLRAMPMWLASIIGGFAAGLLGWPALIVVVVMPVKLVLDLIGHLVEHGKLTFEDLPEEMR